MSQQEQTNIFIAHTPLQNFIAGKIVQQFFNEDIFTNNLYTSVSTDDIGLFKKTHLIEKKGSFKKITQVLKNRRSINNLLKYGNSQIFIPHTAALLDNYYFYDFPLEKYNSKINFYYEGILYFYKYLAPVNKKTHLLRKIIGLLSGINYKIEEEILPVNNIRVNKIYSILKKFTLGPVEKIEEISLLQKTYKAIPGNILIMGGKPSLLENDEVISLYNEMIELILAQKVKAKIFFKGHHADVSNNFEKANNDRLTIIDITRNSPVEEVIEEYSPSIVLSYPSSGLVNLKAMYGEKIVVNSYYIKEKKEHLSKLWPIFEELGVQNTML
jgi:hypothetical protein